MDGWALVIAVAAIFYAWNAKEQAEEAHALARDALYQAELAKTRANDAQDRADEAAEALGQ